MITIKTISKNKNLSEQYIISSSCYLYSRESFKKVAHALINSELLGLWSISVKATMHKLKSMYFLPIETAINLRRINVIFEWYLLRMVVFLVRGKDAKNIEKKKKIDRRKALKMKRKKNHQLLCVAG